MHLGLVGQRANRSVGGFHLRSLALHRHSLSLLADGQREVHHALGPYGQRDSGADASRKTHLRGLDLVVAHG